MGLIVAEKISKDYQVGEISIKALKEVSFEIEPASFVSFVGPSGSGKTTLLNLIGCLDKPTDGNLKVAGEDVFHLDRKQSASFRGTHLGFIFQDFNLIPVLTVFENIEYPLLMVQKVPARRENEEGPCTPGGCRDDRAEGQISRPDFRRAEAKGSRGASFGD